MSSSDLVIGIACILSGTAINSIGLILQKFEVNKCGTSDGTDLARFMRRPLWILGILMQTLLFAPFFFLGIDLIGIALAQPLATAGLVVFVAGAVIVLKERISRVEGVGIAFMVAAVFLVSAAGVAGDVPVGLFYRPSFLPGAVAFVVALSMLVVVGGLLSRLSVKRAVQGLAVLVGTSYAVVSVAGQLVTVGFGALSSPGNEALGWVLVTMGLAGVVVGTVSGILFSQRAFQKAKAIHVIPISQSINNVLPIVAGVYLFGQYIGHAWLFVPGVAVLLVAATLLARFQR